MRFLGGGGGGGGRPAARAKDTVGATPDAALPATLINLRRRLRRRRWFRQFSGQVRGGGVCPT